MQFGYWGVRGAGQISRLTLAYTGVEWTEVKYTERQKWFQQDKPKLGFDFPNLPYLIDGDFKMTQSKAIPRYIIKKSGKTDLLGKTLQDQARVDEILGVLNDVMTAIIPLFWDKQWETKKAAAWQKIKGKVQLLDKFIGNKQFILGYLTLADFNIAEGANYVEKLWPQDYAKFEGVKRIRENFNNLPEIKKYYESETALKGPFVPPFGAIPF